MSEPSGNDFGIEPALDEFKHVSFEEGIIGRWTKFLHERFGTGPMLGKAVGAFMVSSVLNDIDLRDQKGTVKPNIFVVDIARTGVGNKSPVIRLIRRVIKELSPVVVLAPARFNPESLPRYVKGKTEGEIDEEIEAKSKKSKSVSEKPRLIPKDNFVIIKDEMSRLLADRTGKTYMAGMDEVLSDLWDGYIQGNYTNRRGLEGDLQVYASLYGAGSHRFLQLLDSTFFIQGIGNRVLWIDEPVTPPLIDENFFYAEHVDEELDELVAWTVRALHYIKENAKEVIASSTKYWADWVNENYTKWAKAQGSTLGAAEEEYVSKMILNTLKLAMLYAASEFSIQTNSQTLSVTPDNIKMAVDDGKRFTQMWFSLMKKAEQLQRDKSGLRETRLPSYPSDYLELVKMAGGRDLFTQGMFKVEHIIPDTAGSTVSNLFSQARERGHIVEMTETDEVTNEVRQGKLTEEEYKRFKPRRGPCSQVWKITEAGRKWLVEQTGTN